MEESIIPRGFGEDPPFCPWCEFGELRPFGRSSVRCEECESVMGGAMLQTLRDILALPDALGTHACECAHPEMRLIPGGIYRCPACGAEVLPSSPLPEDLEEPGAAYGSGWMDGHYGCGGSLAYNQHLANWESPEERLQFYRGRRQGTKDRLDSTARRDGPAT